MNDHLDRLELELIAAYPQVDWLEPIKVTAGPTTRYLCRLCIALEGVKGMELVSGTKGWRTPQEVRQHLEEAHG